MSNSITPLTTPRLTNQMYRPRILFLFIFTSIAIYFYWTYLVYSSLGATEKLVTDFVQASVENTTADFHNLKVDANEQNENHEVFEYIPTDFHYLNFDENELTESAEDLKYIPADLHDLNLDENINEQIDSHEILKEIHALNVGKNKNEQIESHEDLKDIPIDFDKLKVNENKNEEMESHEDLEEINDLNVDENENEQIESHEDLKDTPKDFHDLKVAKNEQTESSEDLKNIPVDFHNLKTDANKHAQISLEDLKQVPANFHGLKVDENKNEQTESPDDLKYILLWTEYNIAPFYFFDEGQKSFIKNNCPEINCYVTTNRSLLNGDITKFHAVAINGRNLSLKKLPRERSPHQKYIYFNMESADNFPVCDKRFDGFFNWTATYKLDSDIPFPYIGIKNKEGDIIGPHTNMRWPQQSQQFSEMDENLVARLANKTKAAAWFVSHCKSRSGRDQFVKNLQEALDVHGLGVDIYGRCGPYDCPRNQTRTCNFLLERDYFFYLSLENSFAEDYVTEKLLTALQHDTVPIVYGGADYSKFLPPGSYIDSDDYDIETLAATIARLMKSPELYSRFFKWKSQYDYSDPTRKENVCAVCAAMNDREKFQTKTVYNQFRKWWNPNFDKETANCKT